MAAYREGHWLVVSDANAIKLGLVSEGGDSLVHQRTLAEVQAVAEGERLYEYQAQEFANELGGAWVVDTEGNTQWFAPRELPQVPR